MLTDPASEILSRLYRAPIEPDGWPVLLSAVVEGIGCSGGVLLQHNVADGSFLLRAQQGSQADPRLQLDYNRYFGSIDPWREPFLERGSMDVALGSELLPVDVLQETEFFQDYLRGHNVLYTAILPAVGKDHHFSSITLTRSRHEGDFDDRSVRLLRRLQPHFQTAARTQQLLDQAAVQSRSLECMLHAIAQPAILVGANRAVRFSNAAAERLLSRGRTLTMRSGRLSAAPAQQAKLDLALAGAMETAGGADTLPEAHRTAHRSVSLPQTGGRRPLTVLVLPLRLEGSSPPAHALLLFSDPDSPLSLSLDEGRTLYSLTPTETAVANGLLEGLSVREIADRRRLSEDTVRGQLKALFAKTSTSRQGELILLLRGLPRAFQA